MHKSGYILIDTNPIIIPTTLFDSGAQADNYISKSYVDSNIDNFKHLILEHNSSVRLGDSQTIVNITHIITLPVSFLDNNSITHHATLNLSIMPMTHIEMIIGITSILFDLYDLFLDMLKTARNKLLQHNKYKTPDELSYARTMYENIIPIPNLNNISRDIPNHIDYQHCKPTWTLPLDEIAPEELDTPEPTNYPDIRLFNLERDTVLKNYHDLLLTNINPDFIAAKPQVITFMKSQIALSVFCPEKWKGITDLVPLELEFLPTMPARLRTAVRTVRPALMDTAKKEFERLCEYMYVPSNSAITSPLVIAPKADGKVRFCGDYGPINRWVKFQQNYIPIVPHELQKARTAKYFIDLDMKNAFHQIPLALATSLKLSILSEFGNVRPVYMPEGISPASGILNRVMSDVLKSRLHKAIVIHDNFLVLAHDFEETYQELVAFITLCCKRNVILGMKKSMIGFPQVVFFGYLVKDGTYQLTQERKLAVTSLVMPTTLKQIQSFLGATIFFKQNIPDYAAIVAPLNDMCTKDFSFDKTTWTRPYEEYFQNTLTAILNSIAVTMVDMELTLILRTDASSEAWGAVLIQVTPTGTYQCVALASGKWSTTAKKWEIGKQEAAAIVMAVRAFEWTLRGKFFIIESDSKNILFLEISISYIICRWRIYLQGFYTCIRFIKGKYNIIADWLSRQYCLYLLDFPPKDGVRTDNVHTETVCTENVSTVNVSTSSSIKTCSADTFLSNTLAFMLSSGSPETESPEPPNLSPISPQKLSLLDMFHTVHGGRKFHPGIKRTYEDFNTNFPGHKISIRVIAELISECSTCQKVRLALDNTIPEEILHNKQPHYRNQIGIDTLTITPEDKYGNSLAIVIVEHFSKFISIYPCNDHSATHTARAMFNHYVTYGRFQYVQSDPGSDLTSLSIDILNKFLGVEHRVSLTDRHESNGVEPTNKAILAHIRTIVHDLRIKDQWSDPTIIGLVAHAINSALHSETGHAPMELKFGTQDLPYMSLPDNDIISNSAPTVLRELNANLKTIRSISLEYQMSLVHKRSNTNQALNKYQPGDYVLFQYSQDGHMRAKLNAKFLGPYQVLTHIKNDVTVRNLITASVSVFHASRLKPCYSTPEDAYDAALRDADQYLVTKFIAYRGDPLVRTSISFNILFADGCQIWKPWSPDLFDTVQYEDYCRSIPQLVPLVTLLKESNCISLVIT